jgi:hypothetical protein
MNEDFLTLAVPFCHSNKANKKNHFIQKLELINFSKITLYRSIVFTHFDYCLFGWFEDSDDFGNS